MERLLLTDYEPHSELVTVEHLITRSMYDVFDVHTHFGSVLLGSDYSSRYDTREEVERLKAYGVKRVVNLDGFWGDELDRMLEKVKGFEDFILTFGSVDVSGICDKGFEANTRAAIRNAKAKGIRGIKFLKDLSLRIRDGDGKFIPPDDVRLSPVWETAAEEKLPVLIHIADPVAFFKPADRFNERLEELNKYPDSSFFGGGRFTFEQLMESQENLLYKNPKTTFIIAHTGSYSENLAQVGEWLDKYPNMHIDFAARIAELGRQPYTSRAFFERWQDRILFGTDGRPGSEYWPIYFRFLETKDEYFDYGPFQIPTQGRWRIYGLGLEAPVLKKIYEDNANRLLGV